MRILHVVRSDSFAGVERHVADLAAAQSDAGHRVHVVGGDPRRMKAAMGRAAVSHTRASSVLTAAAAIVGHAAQDVINVHMTAAEAAAALAFRARGVPVVSTRHFAAERGSKRITQRLAPFATRRVAAQIAISDYVAQHVEGSSNVVHPGVSVGPDAPQAVDRAPIVLVVQRLEAEKDTSVALSAFAESGIASQGWRLDIAGRGAQQPVLEQQAGDLGISAQVRFLGHRHDVQQLMLEASLLVATCPVEGFGLAVLEAMAVGLPVLAAAAGGHLETAGSVGGTALFTPGNAAQAGRLLAELAGDPNRRDRYGESLRQAQRKSFTLEAQVAATDAVYRSVL